MKIDRLSGTQHPHTLKGLGFRVSGNHQRIKTCCNGICALQVAGVIAGAWSNFQSD